MVTVFRARGLHIHIFKNDHEPAHVHVYRSGEVKINLAGADGLPEIIEVKRMKLRDAAKALALVAEQQEFLFAQWRRYHG